jgi:hypothetical protein
MLSLKTAVRTQILLIRFILSILIFKINQKESNLELSQRVFYQYGGLPGSLAGKLLGKKATYKFSKFVSKDPAREAMLIQKQLVADGFYLEEDFLSRETCSKIESFSIKSLGSYRLTDQGLGGQTNEFFDRENPLAVRYDYTPSLILTSPEIQRVIADPRILEIAQDYFGREPIFDFVAMWWHAKSPTPDKNAAQYFHFDMDRLRWLKFFFYVTDVHSNNGPHVFVPTSHKDNGIPFEIRSLGYTRLTDQDVSTCFDPSIWKTFTGSAGTMIVEDTRGLHKGAHVQSGARLLFQIQLTTSLYGSAEERDDMELNHSCLTEELKESINKFPYVYQKIKVLNGD